MKISCISLKGETFQVEQSALTFRVSTYAVVVHEKCILLVQGKTSGKYWFPGGGVEVYERIEDTLNRELSEETGVVVSQPNLIYFKEEFFYHDVWKEAFHSLRFYYSCKVRSSTLINDAQVQDGESRKPRWVPIINLKSSDFDQKYGYDILQKLIRR